MRIRKNTIETLFEKTFWLTKHAKCLYLRKFIETTRYLKRNKTALLNTVGALFVEERK